VLWSLPHTDQTLATINSMGISGDRLVIQQQMPVMNVIDIHTGKIVQSIKLPNNQQGWRAAPQLAGNLALAVHGQTETIASIFNLQTGATLGSIRLGQVGQGQAVLTEDGLLLVMDGKTLRLIEPLFGMENPVWSVPVAGRNNPFILNVTDNEVLLAPSASRNLIEIRSLAEGGRITRTLELPPVNNKASLPCAAMVSGDRLFVTAGTQANPGRASQTMSGMPIQVVEASLHAFDLKSGECKWSTPLPAEGAQSHYCYPLVPAGAVVIATLKDMGVTRGTTVHLLSVTDGTKLDKLATQGLQPKGGDDYYRYMATGCPAVAGQKLILETAKNLELYGK
jgi:outer membrane protein assembly factor BamB